MNMYGMSVWYNNHRDELVLFHFHFFVLYRDNYVNGTHILC